jgi:nucleotide-binding universal stress UspA family protein
MGSDIAPGSGGVHEVVVGVDETPSSLHALDWASRLVGPSGTLHVVHSVSPSFELAVAAIQADSRGLVEKRTRALGEWIASVDVTTPIVRHVIEDDPAPALLRVAGETNSGLIVVGTHRHQLGPRRVGRTITRLVDFVTVPVAIVPENSDLNSPGTVVVAVDAVAEVRPALRWAAALATERGLALSLVRADDHPSLFSVEGVVTRMAQFLDPSVLKTWAVEDLAELAEEVQRSTDEQLEISVAAPGRRPGPQLVKASTDAVMLVMEARPDPAAPVPSWVHRTIRHAPCAVVAFPGPGSGRAG